MTRQQTRRLTLLIGTLLLPITLYYFSPILPLSAGVSGRIAGSVGTFVLLFLASAVAGRAFCGWLCPMGGVQEACFGVSSRRAHTGAPDLLKYLLFAPLVGLTAYFLFAAHRPLILDVTYQTTNGASLGDPVSYVVYGCVAFLILLMSLTLGKRAFCHHACWIAPFMILGSWLSRILGLPSLRLTSRPEQCVQCKRCNAACPMSLDVAAMVKRGALNHSECILCASCVDACAAKAIALGFGKQDRRSGSETAQKSEAI